MKIIVVHGDDSQKSYLRLLKFSDIAKERGWQVIQFDSENKLSLPETISSTSLFDETRFIIIKDLKLLKPKEIEWIAKNKEQFPGNLVIYSPSLLTLVAIKKFGKVDKIEEYKPPKILYEFLEGIKLGNSKKSLVQFNQLMEKEAPEFIFSMVARQFKDLYWSQVGNSAYPDWKMGKLKLQASDFGLEKIKKTLNFLAEVDYKTKTGQANMKDELDLWLATKLE